MNEPMNQQLAECLQVARDAAIESGVSAIDASSYLLQLMDEETEQKVYWSECQSPKGRWYIGNFDYAYTPFKSASVYQSIRNTKTRATRASKNVKPLPYVVEAVAVPLRIHKKVDGKWKQTKS